MIKSNLKITIAKDVKQNGIWQYSDYLSSIPDHFKLSLGEGGTPAFEFARALVFKREDENPTGSLKDRGMAYLISWAGSQGHEELVLSSSGNAAISAARYCALAKIKLHVFVSRNIMEKKLAEIKKWPCLVYSSLRPVSDAVKFARQKNLVNLRPSVHPGGPEGYQTIAFEILESVGQVEDLFLPVSSGTALVGLIRGFRKFGFLPRMHLCQSAAVCPLASLFFKGYVREKHSLAQALVAKVTPLKNEIVTAVKSSGGSGWVIQNKELLAAQAKLQMKKIITSEEGALVLAAYYKAKEKKFILGKTVVLLTGKKY